MNRGVLDRAMNDLTNAQSRWVTAIGDNSSARKAQAYEDAISCLMTAVSNLIRYIEQHPRSVRIRSIGFLAR